MMFYHGTFTNYLYIGLFIYLIITMLVAIDASNRGYNGLLWALVVLLMPMMGLVFYLIYIAISDPGRRGYTEESYAARTTQYRTAKPINDDIPPIPSDGYYCTFCGTLNSINATFCNNCGEKIRKEN